MATIMVRFKNAERGRYLARRDDKVVVLPKDAPFKKDEVAWKLGFKMIQTENSSFDLPNPNDRTRFKKLDRLNVFIGAV